MSKEPTLRERIAELKKLDKARTQGDWDYDGEETEASKDWGDYGYTMYPIDEEGHCNGFIADFDLNEDDCKFCIKAPTMMEVIREQQRLLEEGEKHWIALVRLIHHYKTTGDIQEYNCELLEEGTTLFGLKYPEILEGK